MGTFGWILIVGAFLVLITVANNSWPWVWAKISRGMPQPGEGNTIVPTPSTTEQDNPLTIPPDWIPQGPTPGSIVPTPPASEPFTIPPGYFQSGGHL